MAIIPKLAMIPSGYKDGKLYSVLPTDGIGDFDVTRGSNATRINKDGLIETVTGNTPRLNYPLIDGVVSGCPSLLLEPSSTNLFSYSEAFDNVAWSKEDLTVLPNQVISPDGTLNADLLLANTNNTDHSIYEQTNASTEIFTVFLKAGGYNFAFLGQNNAADTDGVFFDLINGTVSRNSSTLSASIEDYGNGWFRCSLFGSFSTNFRIICPSENGQTFSFSGDGVKGVYSWGAQLEQKSYATSYIPTSGGAVTRFADTASQTVPDGIIGQTEGTVFFEANVNNGFGVQLGNSTSGSDYVNSYQIAISSTATNAVSYFGGVLQFSFAGSGRTGIQKVALAYKANDIALYINGVQLATDNSATVPTLSALIFNHVDLGTQNGDVKQTKLYNTRLSNSELQALTQV